MMLGNQFLGKKSSGVVFSGQSHRGETAAVSLPYGGTLSIISTLDGLFPLESGWRKLESAGKGSPSVFQTFDWVSSWSKVYLTGQKSHELMVVAGHQNGELVFVLPLMKLTSGFVRTLTWLTDPSGQYGDALLANDQSATVWLDASITLLKKIRGIDIIRFRHVREDAVVGKHAASRFKCANLHEQAPCLDLTQFKNEAEYDARYNSQQRKRRKKIRKNLEELGPVEFKTLPAGILADQAIVSATAEKNDWLRLRGRRNVILKCPHHTEFLKLLSRSRHSSVETVVTELTAGDKPVSWEISFRFNNRHFAYITSHLNELTDLSPGRLHMDLSQRKALADGIETFDLMVPNDQHKESWSSKMVATRDFYMPINARGAVYGWLHLKHVRPLARRIYYRLPVKWLILVQNIIGH